jgi:hypothetical protein
MKPPKALAPNVRKLYIPVRDSHGYWQSRCQLQANQYRETCKRDYDRPWDPSLRFDLPEAQRLKFEQKQLCEQLLQRKAFLSTYRLGLSEKDKASLIEEIRKLH